MALPSTYHVLSDDEIRKTAPSVFANEAHAGLSDRYAYIPTSSILGALRAEGFQPTRAEQTVLRTESNINHAFHMLRFRHQDYMNTNVMKAVGDVIPEIVLTNSHDGSSAYALSAGFLRLICLNGMVVGQSRQALSIRHSGDIIENVIEGSFRVVENMKELMPKVAVWRGINLDYDEVSMFAEAALSLRYPDEDARPISPSSLLGVRRVADRGNDLWTQFNVMQENLIRGGLRGEGSTGKRMTTRAITSVKEDLRINKELWNITAGLAEYKNADLLAT